MTDTAIATIEEDKMEETTAHTWRDAFITIGITPFDWGFGFMEREQDTYVLYFGPFWACVG